LCADVAGHIPQPAHGRWRNPRAPIKLRLDPGPYSIFVDDLDCSSAPVSITKWVRVVVRSGDCDLASGNIAYIYSPEDGQVLELPSVMKIVQYDEPKGWSLEPSPVIFPGELIVSNLTSRLEVTVDKMWHLPGGQGGSAREQVDVWIYPA
jgi:hypothetical protein